MKNRIIRSKSPLRLGLAGGGTDVSPYADMYGGAILNATINLYTYCTIEPLDNKEISMESIDRGESEILPSTERLEINGKLDLAKGVYNRVIKDFHPHPLSFRITTYADAPAGSGLGTSSSMVVCLLAAFSEWLNIPLGEYEMAQLAFDIERKDLGIAGGRQDQYAATFGGVNFMEFYEDDRVIVNPLRIKPRHLFELENNLLLYYTSTSRLSSEIIEAQTSNVKRKNARSIQAMHQLKEQSQLMKEALLKGKIDEIGEILDFGFRHKKQMADSISNPMLDEIYETAKKAGSTGGKISGAGGGGFMIFYCPGNTRYAVIKALQEKGGSFRPYQFSEHGFSSWTI